MTILVAVLVVVALTGCAAFYQAIKGFIITNFYNHDKLEQNNTLRTYPTTIEASSLLDLSIDGYSMVDLKQIESQIRIKFENKNGDYIIIVQTTMEKSTLRVDNEQSLREVIDVGGQQIVYYKYGERFHSYIWNTDYNYLIEAYYEHSCNK